MGTRYSMQMLEIADLHQVRRLFRSNHPRINPKIMELSKRLYRWGGLNPLFQNTWHATYSEIPSRLRKHAKFCVLRDVRSWYISHYLYYLTCTRKQLGDETWLAQTIRLLMLDDHSVRMSEKNRTFLFKHKEAFVDRFKKREYRRPGR